MRCQTGVRGSGTEGGFTLVELIMAIAIMVVITIPLGNVVLGYLRHTDETTGRLLESHDVQIASAYWAQDVASIGVRSTVSPYDLTQSVEKAVPYASSLYPCGTAGTTPLVTLAGDHSSAPETTALVRVAYVVQTVSGQGELHRLRCSGSAAVVSDVTVARGLDPATPPTVACSTACTAAPNVPKTVKLTLTLKDPKNRGPAYTVVLTGHRRQL